MFDIEENLKKLPNSPGVYIHKDKLGQVLYVGKAISLRNRVRQYFRAYNPMDAKVRAMVDQVAEFEYITCGTEMEALILENNLIKKYRPKYNILLRDDKTYPYIKVTIKEKYPRIIKTRNLANDGSKYFGPYTDTKAVNNVVELVNDLFSFKRCSMAKFPEGFRPCLNFHIGKCRGICCSEISEEGYRRDITEAMEIFRGKCKATVAGLRAEMENASENLNFEAAAKIRDQINAINAINDTQRVTMLGAKDTDAVLAMRGERGHYAVLFSMRDGKLSGRESFRMQADHADDSSEIVSEFIKQYYVNMPLLPHEILVEKEIPDRELIEEALSKTVGHAIKIQVPQKGERRAFLSLAKRDVIEMGRSIDQRYNAEQEREENLRKELHGVIKTVLPGTAEKQQYRVEAYDISNTNGVDTVGSMVVFKGMRPERKDYRRFRVKTVEGPDDYAGIQEVVERRIKRALMEDPSFSVLPDIFLMDGGKGQVTAACQAVKNVLSTPENSMQEQIGQRIAAIPVMGMAKDDSHRTRALVIYSNNEFYEIPLAEHPLLFRYFGRIQEEVHRFAIEYHRKVRGRKMIGSVLDNIDGIGPKKRNSLLAYFKSVDNIKKAEIEELCKAEGISKKNAENIRKYFD